MKSALLLSAIIAAYLTASATEPRDLRDGREGKISHMGAGFPDDYLALPIGPGHRVTVCGPSRCLSLTSTDAGPDREALEAGRIADVSVPLFERLCSCPASTGLFYGSWRVGGPGPTLPPTDTAP